MGAAHELVLYVRGSLNRSPLQRRLLESMPGTDGQHFDRVLGPDDELAGSGQAGAPTIYALSLRRGSTDEVVSSLTALFITFKGPEAVLVVTGDYIHGPAEVHRLGYHPSKPPTTERAWSL